MPVWEVVCGRQKNNNSILRMSDPSDLCSFALDVLEESHCKCHCFPRVFSRALMCLFPLPNSMDLFVFRIFQIGEC